MEFYELQCAFSQRIIAFNDAFGRVKTDELIPIRIDATATYSNLSSGVSKTNIRPQYILNLPPSDVHGDWYSNQMGFLCV